MTERRRPYRKWEPVIDHAAEIVVSYDTGVTLRQLFYPYPSRRASLVTQRPTFRRRTSRSGGDAVITE